jgi:hypothetical protein
MQSMGNEMGSKGGIDWKGLLKETSPVIGSLFGNLFGHDQWKNPADAAMPYLNNLPDQLKPYYEPYIQAGQGALPQLQQQFGNLTNDPGGRLNQIGAGYQKSPGFDFALKQALQASGNAAAAGGMAGSPQHEYLNMEKATGLANQDFNNWLSNAIGLYGTGLSGQQNLYNTGFQASQGLGDSLGANELSKALLQYQGQGMQNEHDTDKSGSLWGSLGNLASKALPFFL